MSRVVRRTMAALTFGIATALASAPMVVGAAADAAEAPAPRPAAVAAVDKLYAALLDVMHQGAQLGGEGRYRKLEPAVEQALNLPLMTQVAVGQKWSSLTPEQQSRLVD